MVTYRNISLIAFIIVLNIGCNNLKDKNSTFHFIDKFYYSNKPILLFLADPSTTEYIEIKSVLNDKKISHHLDSFIVEEIDMRKERYFSQLFYTYKSNFLVILHKDSIVSLLPINHIDSIYTNINNYKKNLLVNNLGKISLLKGNDSLKANMINQLFKSQYNLKKGIIPFVEFKNILINNVKKMPYAYNQYLLCKINYTDANYTWIDSLNTGDRILYESLISELQRKEHDLKYDSNILLEEPIFDFGEIEMGKDAEHTFYIKNESNYPAIIHSVNVECGCTSVTWSKQPILSNRKDSINVIFHPSSLGYFNKSITIRTNSKKNILNLRIKGTVVTSQ